MILNIYRLVSPRDVEPRMTIDTGRGPLLVDAVSVTLDGVVASGHLVNGNGKRRAHVPLPPGDVAVLPGPDVEAAVWSHVADAVRRASASWIDDRKEQGAHGAQIDPQAAPWSTYGPDSIVVRQLDGIEGEYWLEMPTVVDAEVLDAEPI